MSFPPQGLSLSQLVIDTNKDWGSKEISNLVMPGFTASDQIILTGSGKVKRSCRLPMENFRKGATAPTETTRAGTAGFRFDADTEIIYIQFCVPPDWDGASDIDVVIYCVLNADETANDIIDWETSVVSAADHEDVDTAPTQSPGVSHDIVGDTGAGVLHKVTITLDYDDSTCPIAAGDNVSITLSRTSDVGGAGYAAGVIVNDICVEYQSDKLGEAV